MAADKLVHGLVVTVPEWGHLRPLLLLSINLLAFHPDLHITLLASPLESSRVKKELTTHAGETDLIDRFQVIDVKSPTFSVTDEVDFTIMMEIAADFAATLPAYFKMLIKGDRRIDDFDNKFHAMRPCFAVYDLFQSWIPEVIPSAFEELHQPLIPLITFLPNCAASAYHHFAKAEHGGMVDAAAKLIAADLVRGMDPLQSHAEHGFASEGKVKELPGLPKMFDFEYWPLYGAIPLPPQVITQIFRMYSSLWHSKTTAVVLTVPYDLEPEAVSALETEIGKPVHSVGFQFPENKWNRMASAPSDDVEDKRVLDFLDRMKAKHGKHSVIYVSFGSGFWPMMRPELVNYLLESLIENEFPFIFSYASPFEQMPKDFIEKMNAREESCMVKFAPQWAVLDHPATGYYLSHCGSNSSGEAIMSELPLVCMPFAADQGEFTAMWVKNGVGIDLKQVKTFKEGNARFHTLYDGTEIVGTKEAIKKEMAETWARLKGSEGKQMREKMQGIRAICEKSWKEGKSRMEMEAFAKYF